MFVNLQIISSSLFVLLTIVSAGSLDPFEDVSPGYVKQLLRYAKSYEMRNYLNTKENPCDDFYEFACGNYYRINPPNNYPYINNPFETISNAFNRKISVVLNDKSSTDTMADMKVKNFYESCMNLGMLQQTYKDKLKEIIKEFGIMPAFGSTIWWEGDFDWLKTVAEIAYRYNIRIIVGYQVERDNRNNTVNRLQMSLQSFSFQSKLVYTDKANESYRTMRKSNMATNLQEFLDLSQEKAEQTAKEIFEFERLLVVGPDNNNSPPELYQHLASVDEIHDKYYPELDVKRLLRISLGYVPTVDIYELPAAEVRRIIYAIEVTPKRIVANYIYYYLLEHFMLIRPKTRPELDAACTKRTKKNFANILDNMVYRKYTTQQMEEDILMMWKTIKTTFERVLDSWQLHWMREITRQKTKEKLQAIQLQINSHKDVNFSREFEGLTLNKHDFVENIKAISMWKARRERAKLSEPPRPHQEPDMSFTPVYILNENLIKVPVSMLQPYFLWSDSYPKVLKFATLGFFISHELIHAFDEEGRLFDETGNQRDWWDNASTLNFMNLISCFSHQYGRYIYNGRHLSEATSQSENIADNGGIRLAYAAYLNWYEQFLSSELDANQELMPHLNYTSKQLFFIAYAQLWCSATHPFLRNYLTSTDEHVPDKFRVIGSLSNLLEFSVEFDCPLESDMNPLEKCIIY